MKFEYKEAVLIAGEIFEEVLNKFGEQRWELIHYETIGDRRFVYLKRQIKESKKQLLTEKHDALNKEYYKD